MYRNRAGIATRGVVARSRTRHISPMRDVSGNGRRTWWRSGAAKALYYTLVFLNAVVWAILLLKGIIALVSTKGSAESIFGPAYPLTSVFASLAILVVGTLVVFVLVDKWCSKGFRGRSPKRILDSD
ncbi:hypothetical protein [Dongia sp.]|uniref:hypothetical protein n=1 Tax=Dongia sp. TaxID=1977262 RepID=UPI0037513259